MPDQFLSGTDDSADKLSSSLRASSRHRAQAINRNPCKLRRCSRRTAPTFCHFLAFFRLNSAFKPEVSAHWLSSKNPALLPTRAAHPSPSRPPTTPQLSASSSLVRQDGAYCQSLSPHAYSLCIASCAARHPLRASLQLSACHCPICSSYVRRRAG